MSVENTVVLIKIENLSNNRWRPHNFQHVFQMVKIKTVDKNSEIFERKYSCDDRYLFVFKINC